MKTFARWSPTGTSIIFSIMLLASSKADADDRIVVTVVNTTSQFAADLHVTFSGTGGNIFVDPGSVVAPGCPVPSVSSNPPTVTNTVVIEWGTACVNPEMAVTFIARTTNGPLVFQNAFWTDALGNNIGAATASFNPFPPFPQPRLPFGALKVASRYIGGGMVWGQPKVVNGGLCWGWWCWREERWCFSQVYFCPFSNRFNRFFELPPWFPVTPWMHEAYSPEKCTWNESTINSPELGGHKPDTSAYRGPPPQLPDSVESPFDRWGFNIEPRYSDDSGETFKKVVDFSSTFFAIYDSLTISTYDRNAPPVNSSFGNMLVEMSKGFISGATLLDPLIAELDSVRFYEPYTVLDSIRVQLARIKTDLQNVGGMLQTGNASDALTFFDLTSNIYDLSGSIRQIPGPRFQNAASNLDEAARACSIAALMIQNGLIEPLDISTFVWATYVQFRDMMLHFASAMMVHARINVNLGSYVWYPSTIPGAKVLIYRKTTRVFLDSVAVPVSNLSEFDIPTLGIIEETLRVWFKLPRFLSRVVDVPPIDGFRVDSISLIVGDVNDDNFINASDLDLIRADLGKGGPLARIVPLTDINGDGIVDSLDLSIAEANLSMHGDEITDVKEYHDPNLPHGFILHQNYPNPFNPSAIIEFDLPKKAKVTLKVYDILGREVLTIKDNEQYEAGTHKVEFNASQFASGVYFYRISAQGEKTSYTDVKKMLLLR